MDPITADRTAYRRYAGFRFLTIDNVITRNLIHRDMNRIIGVDGDRFRFLRRVAAC